MSQVGVRPQAPALRPAEYPGGSKVVDRSTPDRSALLRSVSRKMVIPISAPLNLAPSTCASRKLAFRNCALWKFAFVRSHRKNSTPLAWASVKSAPGNADSVMSVFRRSALRSLAPLKSAAGKRAPRRSHSSIFALRRSAPARFTLVRSARERSAPSRFARAPPPFPAQKRAWASRIAATLFPWCSMLFSLRSPIGPSLS